MLLFKGLVMRQLLEFTHYFSAALRRKYPLSTSMHCRSALSGFSLHFIWDGSRQILPSFRQPLTRPSSSQTCIWNLNNRYRGAS
uniref:Uncharacterized protein n=1 Tax=Aegilops tauschii subsp. strangulata TaxID=200361 RepID=A0A453HP96_AEGTS